MPSSWIRRRTAKGAARFDVQYRLGGRESSVQHAGTFATLRLAKARQRWVDGELAAMRAPDLEALERATGPSSPKLREAAERWRESRRDVSETTKVIHRSALRRLLPHLGDHRVDSITHSDVSDWIATLDGKGKKRETIRKSLNVLRNVLDHAGIEPNPARDRRVKLPREEKAEVEPPTAAHIEAVLGACAPRYRLPIVVLDSTGMRVGELESLTWGDVDVSEGRWRVSRDRSKTRRPRWVQVPPDVFAAVLERVPPEDRLGGRLVFPDLTQERLRTDIARACKASGTPVFSPHDLRHRRISLWSRDGVPWANIGERVGQRNIAVTANTYTHVVLEGEIDRSPFVR